MSRLLSPSFPISRRAVLHCLAGTAAFSFTSPALAQQSGPPAFGTARQQFRVVRPARYIADIPITRLDGVAASFGRFRGKVVLLNFWATWCPACRAELPILDRLQQSTRQTGLQVIAVSVDRGDRYPVDRYVRELQIKHLVIGHDPDGRIAHSQGSDTNDAPFALYGMPITYILNRAGGVEGYLLGEADWSSEPARQLLAYYLEAPAD